MKTCNTIITQMPSRTDIARELTKKLPQLKKRNTTILRSNALVSVSPYDFDNMAEDIDDFEELDYLGRKYNSDNVENGMNFFRLRYAKNKLKDDLNNENKKKNKSTKDISTFDKEKNIRIYNTEFLVASQKIIICFNKKKYQECLDNLLQLKIIKSNEEFGEILLSWNGFDQALLGEFLAGTKPPNQNGEILKSFMKNINFDYNQYTGITVILDILKFVLSRLILPKDSNLILVLLESFSNIFYETNQKSDSFIKMFKDSDSIYLLLSSMLAINTMFTRKDIKNMNVIKRDEFANMNKNIEKEGALKLYDTMKKSPITMSENYYEGFYQKFTTLIDEKKVLTTSIAPNLYSLQKNDQKNLSINFEQLTDGDKKILFKVNKFYRILGSKNPTSYEFQIFEDTKKLMWDKTIDIEKISKCNNCIFLKDIVDVYNGADIAEHSASIKKYFKACPEEEKLYNSFISITYNNSKDTLDLKSDNVDACLLWFKALKTFVNKLKESKSTTPHENSEIQKEIEQSIDEIWKNVIYPSWDAHGPMLKLKLQEKNGYSKSLQTPLKKSSKLDLLTDLKKINNINNIKTFLSKLKTKKVLESEEFYILCYLGISSVYRKSIWNIIIGNPCYISNVCYNNLKNKIKDINNFLNLLKNLKTDNPLITDIKNAKNLFTNEIKRKNINENKLMDSIYKIAKVVFTLRSDISYRHNFIPLIYLFYLIEGNEESAFKYMMNFISNTPSIKLFISTNDERKKLCNKMNAFFDELLQKHLQNIKQHFEKFKIFTDLFFIPWIEDLYMRTLNYKIILRFFDLYLIFGDYVLYQAGITIVKILEEELINSTIIEALKSLQNLPEKYDYDKFFDTFNTYYTIKDDYIEWLKKCELEEQKESFNKK